VLILDDFHFGALFSLSFLFPLRPHFQLNENFVQAIKHLPVVFTMLENVCNDVRGVRATRKIAIDDKFHMM
jgi:hypothetical protein